MKTVVYNCFFIVNTLSKSDVKNKVQHQKQAIKFLKEKFPNWKDNIYLKKENKKTQLHISILKYDKMLYIYNLLRGIKK